MKRKMIGSANGASASRAGATPQDDREHGAEQRGHRQRQRLGDPEDDDHRRGSAARRCADGASPAVAAASSTTKTAGARNRPDRPAPAVERLFGRRVDLSGFDGPGGTSASGIQSPVEHDFRPARSDTRHRRATRRAACRPARRRRRSRAAPPWAMAATADAHAPVPDASSGPTPRSQIRMRTRSGASTLRELDVGAGREHAGGAPAPGPAALKRASSGRAATRRRTADCPSAASRPAAIRPPRRSVSTCDVGRLPHRGAERVAAGAAAEQRQRLRAGIGVDPHVAQRRQPPRRARWCMTSAARQRRPLPDSSDGLPSALSSACARCHRARGRRG